MNAINVLFAALFAAGLFAVVLGLGIRRRVSLSTLEDLAGRGEARRGPFGRLQHEIDSARLGVSAGEFLRLSLILALLGGGAMYLLSNAPLAAVIGFVFGGSVYWMYLSNRSQKALEDYEAALPSIVARLRAGAELTRSFTGAAEYAATYGPENSREDWAFVASQLKAGVPPDQLDAVFKVVADRRGSLLLTMVLDLLLIQQQRGTSLGRTLEGIQESLRERVRQTRKARASLGKPIRELWIVCAVPFWAVIALRIVAPGYAAIYQTLVGQIFLLIGWGLAVVGFALGYRAFNRGLREELDFGGSAGQSRAALRSAEEIRKEKERRQAVARAAQTRGAAPSALAGMVQSSGPE